MKTKRMIQRKKIRWYYKIFLLLKEHMKENIDYSIDINQRLHPIRFLFSQKTVIFLSLLPVFVLLSIFVFSYFQPEKGDMYNINLFDMSAVVATYFGTTFLALVVWHSSWLQKREKENESAIRIHTEFEVNLDNDSLIFYQDNANRINICITNQSHNIPIKIDLLKVYELDKNTVRPITPYSKSHNFAKLLSFNETEKFFIEFPKESFKLPKTYYFLFHISNAYGQRVYGILDCKLDCKGWCMHLLKNATLITPKNFKKLEEKFGINFIKEIVWYSPFGWKRKDTNRIYLFKSKK